MHPVVAGLLLASLAPAQADKPDAKKLTEQALAVLKANCHRCHGENDSAEGGVSYILDVDKLIAKGKVVPGDAKKSRLLRRVTAGDMPPEDEKPRPSAADVATLKAWVEALAAGRPAAKEDKPPEEPKRAFVSAADNLTAIRDHLRQAPRSARRHLRYFTLTHQHNNEKLKAADLRLHQAALAKLLNSLSWKAGVVVPFPVDKAQTVWAVDVRKLDWDRHGLWGKVLAVYPYGLKHDSYPDDVKVNNLASEVNDLAGTWLPAVRADWFIATASKPPLYHDLLRLPAHAGALEKLLKVDVEDNFRRSELARAGFTESGVSRSNRLVERHEAAYGAYWKSYDFKTSDGRGNLFTFPLGPRFKANPFDDQAFEHDGGEVIFSLPNGLQGYLLVDAKDRRIDAGPTEVVRDKSETSGTVAVVNGQSCMFCHQHGMIKDFRDGVQAGSRLRGVPRDKVRELYPAAGAMAKLLDQDEERFLRALDRATGLFLKVGPDSGKDVKDFPEVVGPLVRSYLLKEVDLATAALELGLKDKATLERMDEDFLRRLGLLPLVQGRSVKREVWESRRGLISPFQQVALKLQLGTPQNEGR